MKILLSSITFCFIGFIIATNVTNSEFCGISVGLAAFSIPYALAIEKILKYIAKMEDVDSEDK